MAIISKPVTVATGQDAKATDINSIADTIYNDYNGNITNANIAASAAIALTKIASGNTIYSDTRFKVGTFQINTATATGTQAITGVGFQPTAIIFLLLQTGSLEMSIGFDDATTAECIFNNGTTWATNTTYSLYDYESATELYTGKVNSFDTDGFTIGWTRSSTPTGVLQIHYLALR